MKKFIFTSAIFLSLTVSTGFAAPINNLDQNQTAAGVVDDSFYIEHKFSDNFTLGVQKNDIYGEIELGRNVRAIIGSRNDNSDSSFYAGGALNAAIAPNVEGYVSLVGGNHFSEMQLGANIAIAPNVDLNANYRSFMPDSGSDSNRTTIGATVKF